MRGDIKVRRAQRVEYIKAKKDVPCKDCGVSYPSPVMEFHHLDPNTKDSNFGLRQMKCWSIQRIDEELSNCVVLCANCHRIRHLND